MRRRLRILTWHVHGNYLWYLTQVPHEFYLVTDAERSTHHSGRSGTLPWGDNVHEAPVDRIRDMAFDVVLFQSRAAWEVEPCRMAALFHPHDGDQTVLLAEAEGGGPVSIGAAGIRLSELGRLGHQSRP